MKDKENVLMDFAGFLAQSDDEKLYLLLFMLSNELMRRKLNVNFGEYQALLKLRGKA